MLHVAGKWLAWPTGSAQRRAGEVNGIFPAGCKWRDVQERGSKKDFWSVEEYEYWDEARQKWSSKQPDACLVKGQPGKRG
jgi:hypothetical protein